MARRFRGKVFALLAIIISGSIAFFSLGIPSLIIWPESNSGPQSGVLLSNPLPLSFPIYASLSLKMTKATFSSAWQDLQLYFAGLLFHEERILSVSHVTGYWFDFSLVDYAIFFSFFLLINVVGSAFGYWLSRRAFIDRLSKPVKRVGPALITILLAVTSVYFLFSAYQLWGGYNWAMWTLQSPLPIDHDRAILSYSAVWNYVSLFPVYYFVGLAFGTFAVVTAIAAMKLRRKASFVAAMAMVSSAFLFFETYKIWEICNLATQQVLGPLAYLTRLHQEAAYAYPALFWLYFLSGSIAVGSGIVLMSLGRLKEKMQAYMLKREQSRGNVV